MIVYFYDTHQSRFHVIGPDVNLLVPAGGDPKGFADMVQSKIASDSGNLLPIVPM